MSGFGRTLVEDDRLGELLERAVDEAGGGDPRVGDEQRPLDAELRELLAEPGERARSVHEPRRHLDRADGVDLYRHRPLTPAQALEGLLPPALGALEVVEREDVEAADVRRLLGEARLEPGDERVGVEVAVARARRRSEGPTPIRSDTRRSFAHGTAPGSPMWMGSRVPRSQTAPTQAAVTAGSKQIWLTM